MTASRDIEHAQDNGPGVRQFEDLEVWRLGRELFKGVFRASRTQPLAHERPVAQQMLRAALSITSNIAEGFERGTRKQQIEFLYIAKGSVGELRSQVRCARDVGLLDEPSSAWLLERCLKCSRKLSGYIRYLKRVPRAWPGDKSRLVAEDVPASVNPEP